MKRIGLVLCALLLAGALFARGGSDRSGSSDKPYSGQTLTVLYMSSVYADAARDMVPEFEAATGARVEVVDFPYVTLHEQALLDLTSGATSAYDVIDVASQWDGEFYPFLTKLAPYVERSGYDLSVWIDNVFNNSGKWQGEVIGIPNANTPGVFAYRTDLWPDGLPDTWDEYRAKCIELTGNGMYGATISEAQGQLSTAFYYVLWSMGGAWADENWNVTIDSPETRAALRHMYEMNKRAMDPANLSWGVEESIRAFLDGRASVCETWPMLGLTQNADDPARSQVVGKWALSTIPYEKTGITVLSAWDLAIPARSANKDLAWEWIQMYTSAEKQQEFYEKFGILPPRKAFWEQPSIKNSPLYTLRGALDSANLWWRIAASVEADNAIGNACGAYLSDQISLEEAVAQMRTGLTEALRNSPPEAGIKNTNR